MNNSKTVPNLFYRIFSVWYRYLRVYSRYLVSNGLPPFMESIIFLIGIGLGLGRLINNIDGISYIKFLSSGMLAPPAMYTAAYECSFGTFIRLEFDKVYDGLLSAPINYKDLLIGEILFAGTKGWFFSLAVLIILIPFGLVSFPMSFLATFIGFLTGVMFACLSLLVTAHVKTINHFNIYITGFIAPMFFFSGITFPINTFPIYLRILVEVFPLTHSVRLIRAFCLNTFQMSLLFDLLYIFVFIIIFGTLGIRALKKRLIL